MDTTLELALLLIFESNKIYRYIPQASDAREICNRILQCNRIIYKAGSERVGIVMLFTGVKITRCNVNKPLNSETG